MGPIFENVSRGSAKYQVFLRSKGNMKAQSISNTRSTESTLMGAESNWIQARTILWFVLFVWYFG